MQKIQTSRETSRNQNCNQMDFNRKPYIWLGTVFLWNHSLWSIWWKKNFISNPFKDNPLVSNKTNRFLYHRYSIYWKNIESTTVDAFAWMECSTSKYIYFFRSISLWVKIATDAEKGSRLVRAKISQKFWANFFRQTFKRKLDYDLNKVWTEFEFELKNSWVRGRRISR